MIGEYPIWVGAITVRENDRFWRIIVYSKSFNCITPPKIKKFSIPKSITREEAIAYVLKHSDSVRLHARGCWIITKVKEKYGTDVDGRRELFIDFCKYMKARYDGVNYLYGYEESQNELIKKLNVPDME